MTECDLVTRARGGDPGAFEALVRRHERSLYATAYAMTRSQWDASDLVQDTFAEAYAKLWTLRDAERFGAWISRILVNKCNTFLRRRARTVLVEQIEDRGAFVLHGAEAHMDLMQAIQGLSPDHRQVIALRFFRDLAVDDIAALLGCPAGTVKSRINRALGALEVAMAPQVEQEVQR
jgi:RNA polymerase sigma-70 factor (ECF subfamily)